jgi:sugar phosphate isomerase/epimerase
MYKNLSCDLLGISGRQSEIIELALTYGFRGIEIDMDDLVKRCQRSSFESASRFLASSKLEIAGFDAPIDLDSDDDKFATDLAKLHAVAEIAGRVKARVAVVVIPHGTNRLPYPEYFDVVRKRIDQIAEVFGKENVRLALDFHAIAPSAEEKQFKFVRDVEGFLALVRACNSKNVGIVFDSWNWFVGGGNIAQVEQLGLQRVATVRLADCRDGVAASAATSEDCLLPASTGIIDNTAILKKFVDAGLKIAVAARGTTPEATPTRDAFVGLAQDALDKVFTSAGLPSATRRPEMFVESSYARSY